MIKKIRVQKIEIDMPTETGEMWLRATLQFAYKNPDGSLRQVVDRVDFIYRSFTDFCTEQRTISDPVTGGEATLSGAGCAMMVKKFITNWIVQKYPAATVNGQTGDITIEE